MGPWSFATILASDALTWAVREANKEGENMPAAVYLDHLAERVELTRSKFYQLLAGDRVPTVPQLVQLCQAIGSARAVAALAEDCGLRVCDRKVCRASGIPSPALHREVA